MGLDILPCWNRLTKRMLECAASEQTKYSVASSLTWLGMVASVVHQHVGFAQIVQMVLEKG